MELREKEYFRIYAYRQLMEEDSDYKMSLILNQTMDYKNLLSQSSRIYRRILNLVFGENPDKNMIFFRPLEIRRGGHAGLSFRIGEKGAPFFLEIGPCGTADDSPSHVIIVNHTETEIEFDGTEDGVYTVAVKRGGKVLDPLWKTEDLENGDPEKLRPRLEEMIERRRSQGQEARERLEDLEKEEDLLDCQIGSLEQRLEDMKKTLEEREAGIRSSEAERKEKKNLAEQIAGRMSSRKRHLEEVLEDLRLTPGERQKKKEGYRKHIEFLNNIEKYYKEQKKDEKFAEILQKLRSEAEELNAYYLKLEEIEKGRGAKEQENGAVVEELSKNIF